jgi:4-hydroxy-3-methylbut-2-enyl diphosphate reductase
MEIVLAQPRGFCAGVTRAVDIVGRALAIYGRPVYVYHEIVHNGHVVRELEEAGAIFVDRIDAVPHGAVIVFSAHGVGTEVEVQARGRGLRVIDATCPLVAKVHLHAQRYSRLGYSVVLIGHAEHDEVVGTVGSVDSPMHVVATLEDIEALDLPEGSRVAYVTQTTLSLDDTRLMIAALARRYPGLVGPDVDDICYATQNRQAAVRQLAALVDLVLVIGSDNSSNSHRLREVAEQCGVRAHLIDNAAAIDPRWLSAVRRVGVTAGASAPESLVDGVRQRLATLGATAEREIGTIQEGVRFRLPAAVQRVVPLHEAFVRRAASGARLSS